MGLRNIPRGTPASVSGFIDHKLIPQIGTGARYEDPDMLLAVGIALANRYQEPLAILQNPGSRPCNERQMTLIGALMGLEHGELSTLKVLAAEEYGGEAFF